MGCGAGQSASPVVQQPLKIQPPKVQSKPTTQQQKSHSSLKTLSKDKEQKDKMNSSKTSVSQQKINESKKTSLTKSPSSEKTLTKSVSKDKNLNDKTAVGTNGTSQSNRSSVKNLQSGVGISPSKVKLQVMRGAVENGEVEEVNAENEQDSKLKPGMKKNKTKKKKTDPKINELMRLYGI